MTRLSTAIRYIAAGNKDARKNPHLEDLTEEFKGRDNAAFLAEVSRRMTALSEAGGFPAETSVEAGGFAAIGLIGGYGVANYLIRQAQQVLRVDRTPSYWSHCFLLAERLWPDDKINRSSTKSAWVWESTLEPATPFNHFVERNGVAARRIGEYAASRFRLDSPLCSPNIAIVTFALTSDERLRIMNRADDPNVDQLAYDLPGLMGMWYSYITGTAQGPNPLSDGNAIFCSAYVQLAYDAAGIDLAPGAHERNTAPEHLWQAARYLHHTFRVVDPGTGTSVPRPVHGWYCLRDKAGVIAPVEDLDKHDYRRLSEITDCEGLNRALEIR
jgi:hypothetical protein